MSSFEWNWDEFNPNVLQSDKRDRDEIVAKGIRLVKKNFDKLGIASFLAVPVVDRHRAIEKIVHVYPPNSPLEAFFTKKENKHFVKGLEKAIEDTQMWALELWDLKDQVEDDPDAKATFCNMAGVSEEESDDETAEVSIKKPSKPIFTMTADEISVYYGSLLKDLYQLEGQNKFKLWSKKDSAGNVIAKATDLKTYDRKAEEILPRDEYIGRGSGGANIGNRLKIVSAYLLDKHGIDHNDHAVDIPSNYQKVVINLSNYEELANAKNLKSKAIKSRVAKATKAKVQITMPKKRNVENEDTSDDENT